MPWWGDGDVTEDERRAARDENRVRFRGYDHNAQAVRAAVLTALANVNWRERRDYLNASVMTALKLIDPDLVKA